MKKLYLFSLAVLLSFMVSAQQFSFDVYFEDAIGNRDTITLGYDATASDTINPQYGEVNIVSHAWDSVFEVRLSDYDSYGFSSPSYNPSFQTKKKILNFTPQPPCITWSSPIYIAVKNKHRPFHFTWDSSLFQDSMRMSSGFQFYHYVCPGPIWASSIDSLAFEDPWFYCQNCYFVQASDSIWVIGFQFAVYNTTGIETIEKGNNQLKTYPNPADENIYFDLSSINQNSVLNIYNSLGQMVYQERISKSQQKIQIDISDFKSGVYYYQVKGDDKGIQYSGKFLKQ